MNLLNQTDITETLRGTAVIGAMTAGMTIQEINDEGVSCKGFDANTADALSVIGHLIHMTNAATAASLLDKFMAQGFTREESIPLIAAVLRK